MKPDDHLRAAEPGNPLLARLRRKCSFIGYGMIRRGDKAPLLSMSTTLRSWWGAMRDTPSSSVISGMDAARAMTDVDVEQLSTFLILVHEAWGNDVEYARLYGALNLTLCMWLYRRTVLAAYSARSARLSDAQFKKCLTAMSADAVYLDWLRNRMLSEKNRSPCYNKIKGIFVKRMLDEVSTKIALPQPEWVSSYSGT